jgi:methylated-DNA-[protein]-cysteine S-methyltransferase
MKRFIDTLRTPIGPLAIVVNESGALLACGFTEEHRRMADLERDDLVPRKNPGGLGSKLKRYFAGDLRIIEDVAIALDGTAFQLEVWNALREIPTGETWSYGDLAKHIGRPRAVRAVGLANGMNPVCIVIPCHRVIGSNGTLTGYGGGLGRKEWLLKHEGALSQARGRDGRRGLLEARRLDRVRVEPHAERDRVAERGLVRAAVGQDVRDRA